MDEFAFKYMSKSQYI